MAFLPDRSTLGAKIESTPYTAETLAATDYDVQAYNLNYDSEISMLSRKVARGDHDMECSTPGKRTGTFTFSVDLAYSGTANVAPKYGKLLKGCSFNETVHGATGVSYVWHSDYTAVPLTFEFVEKDEGTTPTQVVIKLRGCTGTVKLVADNIGEPMRLDFEFKGALVSITDRAFGSILTPTGMTDEKPDAILSASVMFYGEARKVGKVEIDVGNDVQLFTDPAQAEGWQGAHVTKWSPTVTIDPDLEPIATHGDFARWTGATTGAMSVTVGSNFTISAPAIQFVKDYARGDREGHVIKGTTFEIKRNAGNDAFKILQGSES